MLRVSKLADYACVIMQFMAKNAASAPSAAVIANKTNIALPTVRKLLKQLSNAGLLNSSRGAGGGYTFTNTASDINLLHIIEAVDGPIALTDCCTQKGCQIIDQCATKESWRDINTVVVDALKAHTLAHLMGENVSEQ